MKGINEVMKNYNFKIKTTSGKEHRIYHVDGITINHEENKIIIKSWGLITTASIDKIDTIKPFKSNIK